jgi:hypothetical protein
LRGNQRVRYKSIEAITTRVTMHLHIVFLDERSALGDSCKGWLYQVQPVSQEGIVSAQGSVAVLRECTSCIHFPEELQVDVSLCARLESF